MATGQQLRGGSPRVFGRVANPAADTARAEQARTMMAEGLSLRQAAVRLGLSAQGLHSLLKRVDARLEAAKAEVARLKATLDPECAHLVCFELPPALPPVERAPGTEAVWSSRMIFVGRLRDMASEFTGVARSEFQHLADLHEHHATFYPNRVIREGDGLPFRPSLAVPPGLIGSVAQACAEG